MGAMPRMPRRIFLDANALFVGIWSESGGARQILRLGEAGALQIVISQQALNELDDVLRQKAPHLLPALARLLDRIQAEIVAPGSVEQCQACLVLTGHSGDACVLAAAWQAGVSYLVSLNQKHILNHPEFARLLPYEVGTPGDFLQKFCDRLEANSA
jgi:predicted nucleic acid-binding protein